MNEKNFDILKNAEDDIIEELIPFPVDNDHTKKRIFEMSEKKYDEMMAKIGNKNEAADEAAVSGVEKYRRPIWYKPLCAAAALAVIVGGISAVGLANRGRSNDKGLAAQVEDTSADANVFVEAATDLAEADTEAPAPAASKDPRLIYSDTNEVPSEEEMKAIFERYLPVYMELKNMNANDVLDFSGESVGFWLYGGEDPEGVFNQNMWPNSKKEGVDIYDFERYYKINDDRFGSLDEFLAYYDSYFAYNGQYVDPNGGYVYSADLSGRAEGDKITDKDSAIRRFDVIGYDGALYASLGNNTAVRPDEWNGIISDRAYCATENKFVWERINKRDTDSGVTYDCLDMEFVKCEDGAWRIAGHGVSDLAYDRADSKVGAEFPLLYEFDGYGEEYKEALNKLIGADNAE